MPPNAQKYKIDETTSTIVHQLKNPIAIIRGYLEALISEDFGQLGLAQKEYLSDALINVKRMSKTVDNLIIISMIEEKKYKLNLIPLALEEITLEVIKDFSRWARASNCRIVLKKPKNLPKALADPSEIKEVIENLLSNAIKYNLGKGEIAISLFLKAEQIIFCCRDNGIGISKQDFKKVFTKFYRTERAREIDPSGSGLGLYINKAIVELSGGKIWLLKNKKRGMTFCFSLPTIKHGYGKETKNFNDRRR